MNITLDILFLIATAVIVFVCVKRGFLKSVIHFLKTILAFVIAYFLGAPVGKFLCEKIFLPPVRNSIYEKVNSMYGEMTAGFEPQKIIDAMPSFAMTEDVKQKLLNVEGTGEELVNTVTDSITSPIATAVSNVVAYVGVFVIAFVGLWLLAIILTKMIENVSLLDKANKILGGVLGLLIALTTLAVIASLLKLFWANEPIYADTVFVKFLGDSSLLKVFKFLDITSLLGK